MEESPKGLKSSIRNFLKELLKSVIIAIILKLLGF